jgi:biopolymer transport protein TolR
MYPRQRRKPLAEMNVIPYIDVMLVLLVIFMITAPLLTEGVKVELPTADASQLTESQQMPLIVTVDRQGAYYFNHGQHPEHPLSAADLIQHVQQQRAKNPAMVFVKGDAKASYGQVVNVMVLLQQAGIDDIGLMTQSMEQG